MWVVNIHIYVFACNQCVRAPAAILRGLAFAPSRVALSAVAFSARRLSRPIVRLGIDAFHCGRFNSISHLIRGGNVKIDRDPSIMTIGIRKFSTRKRRLLVSGSDDWHRENRYRHSQNSRHLVATCARIRAHRLMRAFYRSQNARV